jgi:exodeoxyribonuclease V alpha subunit
MAELTAPTSPTDRRIARRVGGLLHAGTLSGLLVAADAHVADRIGHLVREDDERVLLALALAVRAVRTGSVACDLAAVTELDPDFPWPELDPAAWLALVAASPVAASGIARIEFGLLYLERYWEQERTVAGIVRARAAAPAPTIDSARLDASLERLFPNPQDDDQRTAAGLAVRQLTTIVTGGPGTGKTTVIAKILALAAEMAQTTRPGHPFRVALAAPTAKAATRLGEAVTTATTELPPDLRALVPSVRASTLHRLLGWTPQSHSRFRHNRDNRLPHDLVVLDEASMVSLTLMTRLVESLRPAARLVVVGDPDQLASVEAGAVLADLVAGIEDAAEVPTQPRAPGTDPARHGETQDGETPDGDTGQDGDGGRVRPPDVTIPGVGGPGVGGPGVGGLGVGGPGVGGLGVVARLRHTYRFQGAIRDLAQAIRDGDADAALAILTGPDRAVSLLPDATQLRALLMASAVSVHDHAVRGDAAAALQALSGHRLLCAHRTGPYGVSHWNGQVERWLSEETGETFRSPMYPGRPLLVTTNDYGLDLYNGDTGIVVVRDGRLVATFDGGAGLREVAAARLSDVETMYAATVHKSQGSQARRITVILPEIDSPLLTRELFYTAVTRAQEEIAVIATPEVVRAALDRRIQRASGLRRRLAGPGPVPAGTAISGLSPPSVTLGG